MRYLTAALLVLLGLVHLELWFGGNGWLRVARLQGQLAAQQASNDAAVQRNTQLAAELRDLREGLEMVEERARFELGMLKPDEILVQYAPRR